MRLSLGKRSRQTLMAGIMLVAFASRALIPPGFMPANGRPFLIEVCPEGLPAEVLAQTEPSRSDSMDMASMDMDPKPADSMAASQRDPRQGPHHHGGSPAQSEHCVFGSACSAGPIPHLPPLSDFSSIQQLRAFAIASIAGTVHLVYLPQPRAPPGQLS
jgi:hypothetical protein